MESKSVTAERTVYKVSKKEDLLSKDTARLMSFPEEFERMMNLSHLSLNPVINYETVCHLTRSVGENTKNEDLQEPVPRKNRPTPCPMKDNNTKCEDPQLLLQKRLQQARTIVREGTSK